MALSILTRRLLFCFLLIWAGLVIYLFLVHQEQVSHEATKHQQVSWEQRLHLWQHSQRRNNSWAGPCTRCEEGACCWELRNRVLRAEFTDRPYLQWRSFQLTDEALHLPVATFPLFRLLPTTQDFSCSLQGVRRNGSLSLEFDLSCDAGWQVIFRAHLRHEDSHYMRFKVHLVHSEDVVWKGGYRELHLWKLHGSSHVQETKLPQNEEDSAWELVKPLCLAPPAPPRDVFARNEHRATALHYSSVEGCLEVSKALLSKVEEGERSKLVNCGMAKVYNRHLDCYGERTPLAAAAESGFEDSTALLLAAGATFEADDEGRTPLWLAARHGRVEVVQVLLKHGADASQQDQSGVSVLNANTGGGRCHEDLISLLLSANVDVNQTSGSPLCDAVKGNKKQVVEALLTHGASTNMPNASGTTALHAACERGDESLVQLLVRFRADPGAANAAGSTPQELLRRRGLAAQVLEP
ncbi:Putative ankyrin repeat protein MM_0045 [Durusdinium trenchii]|uniref:Ankyrin repeat protein MM_0045 n=1 Tax=Durusdinium trenchii TaxID=1381693 RepID=A0ABP0HZS9_9DINO